jgi:hypothetical protein
MTVTGGIERLAFTDDFFLGVGCRYILVETELCSQLSGMPPDAMARTINGAAAFLPYGESCRA